MQIIQVILTGTLTGVQGGIRCKAPRKHIHLESFWEHIMSEDYKSEEYNETRKLSVTTIISFILFFVSNICFPDAVGQNSYRCAGVAVTV